MKKLFLLLFSTMSLYSFYRVENCVPFPNQSHSAILGKPVAQNVVLELGMTNYYRYHAHKKYRKKQTEMRTNLDIENGQTSSENPIDGALNLVFNENFIEKLLEPLQDREYESNINSTDVTLPPAPEPLSFEENLKRNDIPAIPDEEPYDRQMLETLQQEFLALAALDQDDLESESRDFKRYDHEVYDDNIYDHDLYDYESDNQETLDSSISLPSFVGDIFPFFFVSTNKKDIAKYLLPNSARAVTVADNNTSDISSPWLGITTPAYSSCLKIRPQRAEVGFAFNLFGRLSGICDYDCAQKFWLNAFIPVEWVQHSLHIETLNTTPSTAAGDGIAAFNNPAWCFGKLPCKSLHTFGVADILLRAGYDALLSQCGHFSLYAMGYIPTSHGLRSEYLFEPTLGNLGHWGVGGGINGEVQFMPEHESTSIYWMTDIRAAYFFKRHEIRSSDLLVNLDWSRYLEVAAPDNLETPLPGINYFTQRLMVKPRGMVNLWTSLHIDHCDHEIEIGYNFWWRQKEIVEGFCNPDVVIYDIQGTPGLRTSSNTATIFTGAPGVGGPLSDLTPMVVNATRFSSDTPAIPNLFINTVYASYGREFSYCEYAASLISAGLYYDMSHHRNGFSGVGGWLKATVGW